MKYKDENIELQTGDIVLFRNEFIATEPMTWISSAIRFFTKTKYNHAALIVRCWGKYMLLEANEKGIICRPAERRLERSKTSICVLRRIRKVNERNFSIKAMSKLGDPYDFGSLFLHQLVFRLFGFWMGRTKDEAKDKMVCTEYVAWTHNLKEWWTISAKELLKDEKFFIFYTEK